MLLVLVNVAFITLLERKILGYSQLRLGPNKPSLTGVLQPMADAVKLFTNSFINPYLQSFIFPYIPLLSLWLVLIIWTVLPSYYITIRYAFSLITFLALMRISVYPIMLAGWSSNSKYSELGRLRNIAQTISYEVRFALIISILILNLNILSLSEITLPLVNLLLWPFMLVVWLIVLIAETNRTPFDFSEGERELVSGFNTEYSSNKFAVVFMAEYASIYLLSMIRAIIFLRGRSFILPLITALLISSWVWIRTTFPRHRYDYLIILNWKRLLPLILLILVSNRVIYRL